MSEWRGRVLYWLTHLRSIHEYTLQIAQSCSAPYPRIREHHGRKSYWCYGKLYLGPTTFWNQLFVGSRLKALFEPNCFFLGPSPHNRLLSQPGCYSPREYVSLGKNSLFIFYDCKDISFCKKNVPQGLELTTGQSGEPWIEGWDFAFGIRWKLFGKNIKRSKRTFA